MQVSFSRIGTFENCPYKYHLSYNENLTTIFNCDPQNPLVLGTALHTGIEKDVETAINQYYLSYPRINDLHINEAIKLENLIPKVKAILPEGDFEVKIDDPDFVGYIDLLVEVDSYVDFCGHEVKVYDIYDFKYSNNEDHYKHSAQLHLYKYFLEKNPYIIVQNLNYVLVPKTMIRQKKDEDLYHFRKRLNETLNEMQPKILPIEYDESYVIDFLLKTKHCIECENYQKNITRLCDWCDFKNYCQKGENYMLLPKNEKKQKVINTEPDMWIYADSYVGKTTFVDNLDDLLFVNTDGNVENITSPHISIANEIVKNGRMSETVLAWEKFLELVSELEKKENDFKVIALDLVEDLFEHCRLYMYNKLNIEHEQDAGFGKGWDMVRTEFCSTIKRLKHLGYRIIYISKELKTEISLKNGSKLTSFAPNINEKVANILAGTVTLTVRAYMDNRGRFLQLAKQENIFGGGRFNFVHDKCELDMNVFREELRLAQSDRVVASEETQESEELPKRKRRSSSEEIQNESNEENNEADINNNVDEENVSETTSDVQSDDVEEKPVRRRRRRVAEE